METTLNDVEYYLKNAGRQVRNTVRDILGMDVDKLNINILKPTFNLEDRISVTNGTAHKQPYILDNKLVQVSQIHCIASANAAFTFKIFENDSYAEEALVYYYNQSNGAARRFDDLIYPELIYYAEIIKGLPQLYIEIDKTAAGTVLINFKVRGFIGTQAESV